MRRPTTLVRTTSSLVSCAILLAAGLAGGCAADRQRERELTRVAKDWCQTIRAAQVIPVYPPTADLVPGDLFLVRSSVAEQHREYAEKGFLALPYKIKRLQLPASAWDAHYTGVNDRLHAPIMPGSVGANRSDTSRVAFADAFTVGFPTYSFSVRRGGSFDLAVPISSVPIGVSALGAGEAAGSVTIRQAKTYGLDAMTLASEVARWADDDDARTFLEGARRAGGGEVYVRVVSRVYLAREFDVSISAAQTTGFGAQAGASTGAPAAMFNNVAGQGPEARLEPTLDALNSAVESNTQRAAAPNALPGGSVRFVAASARSVGLRETFDEPIAVGYVGFDMRVLDGGGLGHPIPTFAVLEDADPAPTVRYVGAFTSCEDLFLRAQEQFEILEEATFESGDVRTLDAVCRSAAAAIGPGALRTYQSALGTNPDAGDVSAAWGDVIVETRRGLRGAALEQATCDLADALERGLAAHADG